MVGLWNFSKPQKQLYILLDMLFFSFGRTDNALLYRERRIFNKRNSILRKAERNNSPSLSDGKPGRYVLCKIQSFHACLIRVIFTQDGKNPVVNFKKPHLMFHLVCSFNYTMSNVNHT